jgi:hypothetical protein
LKNTLLSKGNIIQGPPTHFPIPKGTIIYDIYGNDHEVLYNSYNHFFVPTVNNGMISIDNISGYVLPS